MQEEIKKVALPSALQGIKLKSTLFFSWENRDYNSKNDLNKFVLERAYFSLEKELSDKLSMNVTADVFESKDPDDRGNGLDFRVKYAYLDYKLWGTSNKVGMVPTPSDSYDSAIWPYRVQGKHLLDALGIMSSADLGLVNQGVVGGYMDDDYLKYGSKDFGGK